MDHVLPKGRQRAVPGLVGYRPVARPSQVGVSDEPGPERVGGVGESVETGMGNGRLDKTVGGVGVQPAGPLSLLSFTPTAERRDCSAGPR